MDIFEKLQENYISVESICGSIQEGVIIASSTGNFLYWNESAKFLMGNGPKDLPPAEWATEYNIYDEKGSNLLTVEELPMMRALRGETFTDFRAMTRNLNFPQGIVMSISGKPIRSGNATVGGVVTFRDIEQVVRLEERIRSERLFYVQILDVIQEIVFIKNLKGEVIFGNKSFKLLESTDEILLSENDKTVFRSGQPGTFEEGHFIVKRFPYRNTLGDMIGICAVAKDMSAVENLAFLRYENSELLSNLIEKTFDKNEIIRKLQVIQEALDRMAHLSSFSKL